MPVHVLRIAITTRCDRLQLRAISAQEADVPEVELSHGHCRVEDLIQDRVEID